jgi:hypothetical protein
MATQTINYDINVNAGASSRTIQQIEQELNELNQEIKEVGVGSAAFNKAAGNIQKLEKELKSTQATVEGFTLDKKLEAADGAIKVVAGSVAGLTGAVGLLGIESEEFDKLTAQATNAIAFGMGIKDVSEGVGKLAKNFSIAGTKAKVFAAGQKILNLAQRAFNAILAANPIGLTILAITTLVGLVVALKDKFEAVNKVFQFFKGLVTSVGEALGLTATAEEKAAQAAKEASEQRVKDIDNELKVRKAAGESTVEIEREKQRLLTSLTLEGSQERKDAEADAAAFEAAQLKAAQDIRDKAAADRRAKRKAAREKQKAEDEAAAQKKLDEEKAETERLAQAEVDRLKTIDDIKQEFLNMIQERDAETELAKAELDEERKLAELEELGADEEAIQAVRDYYSQIKTEAALNDKATQKAIVDQEAQDAIDAKMAEIDGKAQLEQAYIGLVGQFGQLLGQLAGESKELQIAAVVAQQAASIGQIISSTAAANAKAVLASPITAGQPWVTINTVSAGLGIAGSIAGAAKSISQIKNSDSGGGSVGGAPTLPRGASSAPTISSANIDIGTNPETNVDNTAVQAYIISGDITSSQEAEAKLSTRRAIGG